MRGSDGRAGALFSYVDLEARVPAGHDTAADEGAAVVDHDRDPPPVREIGHPHRGAEGQGAVRGGCASVSSAATSTPRPGPEALPATSRGGRLLASRRETICPIIKQKWDSLEQAKTPLSLIYVSDGQRAAY
jgi:hypothetical protein